MTAQYFVRTKFGCTPVTNEGSGLFYETKRISLILLVCLTLLIRRLKVSYFFLTNVRN